MRIGVILLVLTCPDSSPATAAPRGTARRLLGARLSDGVNRAGNELEKIIASRDLAMREREKHVEAAMHDMVTTPWATVHPLKLKRDEMRDEALVKQAERQVKADQKLLGEAKTVSAHDKKLWTVAVARKSLSMNPAPQREEVRKQAIGHLAAKQDQAHDASWDHGKLLALAHAYKAGKGTSTKSEPARTMGHQRPRPSSGPAKTKAEWHQARMPQPAHQPATAGPAVATRGAGSGEEMAGVRMPGIMPGILPEVHSNSRGDQRGGMRSRFEAVHHKAESIARLGHKHAVMYASGADLKAHQTVESLPYLLPPAGVVLLVLVAWAARAAKRSAKTPRVLDASRQHDVYDVKRGLGHADGERDDWLELGSTV